MGIEGRLIDFDRGIELEGAEMTKAVIEDLREHAQQLGCERELSSLTELVEQGTGARRQLDWFAEHGDVHGLMREIVDASAP